MSIWFRPYTLEELDGLSKDSMIEYLDIHFTEIGPDYLRATMPADKRTWRPYGLLHGGASVTLARLDAMVRDGRAALIDGGVVLGSVDRLPVGLEVGGTLSDPNLLAKLPTRVDTQWFVGISFSFPGWQETVRKAVRAAPEG